MDNYLVIRALLTVIVVVASSTDYVKQCTRTTLSLMAKALMREISTLSPTFDFTCKCGGHSRKHGYLQSKYWVSYTFMYMFIDMRGVTVVVLCVCVCVRPLYDDVMSLFVTKCYSFGMVCPLY